MRGPLLALWGGALELASMAWQLREAPLARIGPVVTSGLPCGVTTRITGLGPAIQPGGGQTRAYRFAGGRVVARVDALHTPQTEKLGIGCAQQSGAGPLPAVFSVPTGSHAWEYGLTLRNPQR